MKENKLISYVISFSTSDWNSFLMFSKSQFTERNKFNLLFEYLKKSPLSLRNNKFDLEHFHQKIDSNLSTKSFQNLMLAACEPIEEYFIWKEIQESKANKNLHLLSALQKRGLFQEFDKLVIKIRKEIRGNELSIWNYLNQMQIDHLQYFSDNPAKTVNGDQILESLFNNFISFTKNQSLFYKTEMINRNASNDENWDDKIEAIETNASYESELAILLNLILLTQSGDRESYLKLHDILLTKASALDNELQIIIQIHLHKYLDENILDTKVRGTEKLKLFSFALDRGHLNLNKKLPLVRFHNIVDTACRLKEFEWAENFITSSSKHLSTYNLEDTLILAKAQVFFAHKNRVTASDGVIDQLRNISFPNFRQELRAKTMLICSYFESKGHNSNKEFIRTSLNTYKRFLVRRKKELNDDEYIGLTNLIEIIKLLSRKKPPQISTILKRVNENKVFFKSWVIARIEELQSPE